MINITKEMAYMCKNVIIKEAVFHLMGSHMTRMIPMHIHVYPVLHFCLARKLTQLLGDETIHGAAATMPPPAFSCARLWQACAGLSKHNLLCCWHDCVQPTWLQDIISSCYIGRPPCKEVCCPDSVPSLAPQWAMCSAMQFNLLHYSGLCFWVEWRDSYSYLLW